MLSPRLQTVAELVLAGMPVADVGTDHALLPIALVRGGVVPRAIASDVHAAPLARAARAIDEAGIASIDLRRGEGLEPLRDHEVATIVIAGMGGARIRSILDRALPEGVRRLVLQPNTDWEGVRAFAAVRGLGFVDERLVEDAGRPYLVLALEPGRSPFSLGERERVRGPILADSGDPGFLRWVARERARVAAVLGRLEPDRRHEVRRRLLHRLALLDPG